MKKLSLSVPEFDDQIKKLYDAESAENNGEVIRKAEKIINEVIRNDLTERQKQIILLYYYKNMTMAQIADMLSLNVSTVSRILARARKNIYQKIKYYFF